MEKGILFRALCLSAIALPLRGRDREGGCFAHGTCLSAIHSLLVVAISSNVARSPCISFTASATTPLPNPPRQPKSGLPDFGHPIERPKSETSDFGWGRERTCVCRTSSPPLKRD